VSKPGQIPQPINISRRNFLRIAGITGGAVAASSAIAGYQLYDEASGELPEIQSPFDSTSQMRMHQPNSVPLLVVTGDNPDNPFASYLIEILLAEGINYFQISPYNRLTLDELRQYAMILLTDCAPTGEFTAFLEEYVVNGGNLVAMRPGEALASLCGVKWQGNGVENGYLLPDDSQPLISGASMEALQFFGQSGKYGLDGAVQVAGLTASLFDATQLPAVTYFRVGEGQVSMWAFDLARSVVLARQGNPAWVNQERDDRDGLRAQDMFVGWIDLERVAIPQVDELMRLLSRLIAGLLAEQLPILRLWYFPAQTPSMLIATGDAHENPADLTDLLLRRVESYGGTMSVYYTPPLSTNDLRRSYRRLKTWLRDLPGLGPALNGLSSLPTPHNVADWRARGHEFGLHPYVESGLEHGWQQYWQEFTSLGYAPVSPTTRTHRILWTGWVETARIQAQYGIRMNMDYYHYGPAFQQEDGEWVYGHFNGSGLPMKFMDENGQVLNIYQQNTQLVDEHLIRMPWGMGGSNVGGEEAARIAGDLLQQAVTQYPAAFAAQFHFDPFALGGDIAVEAEKFLVGTLEHANSLQIPIWNAEKWLVFNEVRSQVSLTNFDWNQEANQLAIQATSPEYTQAQFELLIPAEFSESRLVEIKVGGTVVNSTMRKVNGLNYAGIRLPAGIHELVMTYA
jgi:hypothetical protein